MRLTELDVNRCAIWEEMANIEGELKCCLTLLGHPDDQVSEFIQRHWSRQQLWQEIEHQVDRLSQQVARLWNMEIDHIGSELAIQELHRSEEPIDTMADDLPF